MSSVASIVSPLWVVMGAMSYARVTRGAVYPFEAQFYTSFQLSPASDSRVMQLFHSDPMKQTLESFLGCLLIKQKKQHVCRHWSLNIYMVKVSLPPREWGCRVWRVDAGGERAWSPEDLLHLPPPPCCPRRSSPAF